MVSLNEKGIELEFRLNSHKEEIPQILKNLEKNKYEIIESVTLINETFRQEYFFKNGEIIKTEIIQKEIIENKFMNLFGRKFKKTISKELPTTEKHNPKVVRIKYRYRFTFDNWFCDITAVNDPGTNFVNIKKNRIEFFDRMEKNPNLQAGECWELELEHRNPAKYQPDDEAAILAEIFAEDAENPLSRICQILKIPYNNLITLKKILPNAIELSKNVFITELWPEINEGKFAVTDKADGERMILYAKDTVDLISSDKNIRLHDKWKFKESIFECEVIDEIAYIYDILMLDGQNLVNEPFEKRWQPDFKLEYKNIKFKKFYFLNSSNYKIMKTVFEQELPYETDGVIFSSTGEKYRKMRHYKWKPIERMSIDFLCRKAPVLKPPKDLKQKSMEKRAGLEQKEMQDNLYFLFCSISAYDFKNLALRHIRGYEVLFERKKENQFPVHFCPSSQPLAYQFRWDGEDLDNKIVEFGYQKIQNFVGRDIPALRFMRIREDREDDLKKGYYGNYFKIAEMIWNNFNDPLVKDIILDPAAAIKDMYFQKPSDEWEKVRKNNNNMKRELIYKFARESKWALDFACGKGQDLLKYRDSHVKNIIMVDSVPDNISQVISRKYDIARNTNFPINIYTFCVNLLDNASTICQEITNNGVPFDEIDFISCNLAIHYLIGTQEQFENTINLFAKFMDRKTKLMITSLDGAKIFKLLKKGNFVSPSKKFAIRKLWKDNNFIGVGQKISIKLPFAENEMEETLVNYKAIENEFKKYKIKMVDFGTFNIEQKLELTDEEKDYVNLHSWAIFSKS